MRRLSIIAFFFAFHSVSFGEIALQEAKEDGMGETLQNYIRHNSVIVDICVYEQAWIPPESASEERKTEGKMIQRAVVTHVHCGSLQVGDRVEYVYYIEDPPRFLGRFTATVPGRLRTFFYNPDGSEKVEGGMLKIDGDGHWGFDRVGDVFAELFAIELESNPKLKK